MSDTRPDYGRVYDAAKQMFEQHCLCIHGIKYNLDAMPGSVQNSWREKARKYLAALDQIAGK